MSEAITHDVCCLHREVIDGKIELLKQKDAAQDERIGGMESKLDQVYDLQRLMFLGIIGILITSILVLIGVIIGRGVDFGLITGAVV